MRTSLIAHTSAPSPARRRRRRASSNAPRLDQAVADADRRAWRGRRRSASCVTRMIVMPSSRVQLLEHLRGPPRWCCESRLPVGSSANSSGGLVDQRPGDGDALLLAAGELRRVVVAAGRPGRRARAAPSRALLASRSETASAVYVSGIITFSRARGARQQVEALEDEADLAVADARPARRRRAARPPRRRASTRRRSGGRGSRGCSSACVLPEPRRAHQRDELAAARSSSDTPLSTGTSISPRW